MKSKQMPLPFRTRGGKRKGAGRPPKGKTALVSHDPRPKFEKVRPVHVTLRIGEAVPSLRSSRRFKLVKSCFAKAQEKMPGMRLVEFSVLSNHLHLIVEADSNVALSRGVQGLCIRLARALNAALKRCGRVFADHFHSRLLGSPTQVVNAIRYVLENAARHYGGIVADAFSSETKENADVLVAPEGWMLRRGWLSAPRGLLDRLLLSPKYRRRFAAES